MSQPILAALRTGLSETCGLEGLRLLAATTDRRTCPAALVPAGRARACRREPLLRRMPARWRGHTSTVGLQTQVREDLLAHWLFEDRRDDLQPAAAVRAVRHVDLEHALEPLGPAQPNWAVMGARRLALGGRCSLRGCFGFLRHHLRAQLGVGHQRSQALYEVQRRHHQVRGAIAPSGLELEHDLSGGVGLHALVGQSGTPDGAAQLLKRLAIIGAAAHGGVQAEALDASSVGAGTSTKTGSPSGSHRYAPSSTTKCRWMLRLAAEPFIHKFV